MWCFAVYPRQTLSYADATKYPDDQNALNQLVNKLAGVSDISNQSFDVWREKDGGAIVLVPAGADLSELDDHCLAQLSGVVKEVVWGQQLLIPIQLSNLIFQFEANFGIAIYGVPVFPVPAPTHSQRPDGARFNRVVATLGQIVPGQNPLPKAAIMQKSMSRGGYVVIVQIANEAVGQIAPAFIPYGGLTAPQFSSQCASLLTGINCNKIAETAREVVAFQLAAELSTYPPY